MMQASFCIFFAPVANCIFTVLVPPCEEKCRCPEGCNPFGSGFPIRARSTLLAHDFARQSLVCYTFCDRDAGKELSPYRTDHFLWQQKDGYLQAQEACGYSFFGCRRCSKAQVEDRNCAALPREQKVYKARRSDAFPQKVIDHSSILSSIFFETAIHASMMDASKNVRRCSYHHGSFNHTLSRACASVLFALLSDR